MIAAQFLKRAQGFLQSADFFPRAASLQAQTFDNLSQINHAPPLFVIEFVPEGLYRTRNEF